MRLMKLVVILICVVFCSSIELGLAFADTNIEIKKDLYGVPRFVLSGGSYGTTLIDLRLFEAGRLTINGTYYNRNRNIYDESMIGNTGGEISLKLYSNALIFDVNTSIGFGLGFSTISSGVSALMVPTQSQTNYFISPSFGIYKKIGLFYLLGIEEIYLYQNNVFNMVRFGVGI